MAEFQTVNLYSYVPSLGFNAFATAAFAVLLLIHGFWFVRYSRTRTIQGLICLFAASELVVYAIRIGSHKRPYEADYWAAQYVLNLFSPTWLVIALLLSLTKAYKSTDDGHRAVFHGPLLVPMLLIGYQVIVGVLILVGASLVASNRTVPVTYQDPTSAQGAGIYPMLVGLGNQVGVLTVIQALLIWTFISLRRASSSADSNATHLSRIFLALLFLSIGMIWTRSIFRLVGQSRGFDNFAVTNEALFGVFEFAQVFAAGAVWAVWPLARGCDEGEGRTGGVAREGKRYSSDSGVGLTF